MKKMYYFGSLIVLLGIFAFGFSLYQHVQFANTGSFDLLFTSALICLGAMFMNQYE